MTTMRNDDWNRCYISLMSEGQPRLRNEQGEETQEGCLYRAITKLGGQHLTLDQIVEQCEKFGYKALLKTEPSVRNSLKWHLRNWVKPDRNIVKIEFFND